MSETVADTLRGLRFGPFQALLLAATVAGSVFLLTTPYYYWALVPGPAILGLFLLGRYPQVSLYIFIFLIPFEFLTRWSSTQSEITVSKFLGVWTVIVSLFMVLLGRWRAKHLRSALWPFILAYVLINVVSTLNSDHLATAVYDVRLLLVAVTVFALVLLLSTTSSFVSTIPTLLVWGVMLNYAIFLLEFRFGVTMPWVEGTYFPRDVSMPAYAMPTAYSIYFVFLLPFLVHRFFFSRGHAMRALYGALAAVAVSGMMYLGSRAAFVVTLFLVVILTAQYLKLLKPRLVGFLLAGLFAGVALLIVFTPEWYLARQKSMFDTKTEASVSQRVTFLRTGWQFFKQKPILGFGPGAFMDEYATTLESASYATPWQGYRMRAHNTYLEILVGTGLLGLLSFLAIVGIALRNFRVAARNFRRKGELSRELLANAYQAAFVVNLLYFLFISYLTMKHFWIFLALSQITLNVSERSHHGEVEAA